MAARRHIEKQVLYHDVAAGCHGAWLLYLYLGTFYHYSCSGLTAGLAGLQFHLRYRGNRCQRLAPEAHCAYLEQVVYTPYFAGGMPLKAHTCIGGAHALT